MRDCVRAAFVSFTAPLEGVVPWMYADVKGLVTTAIGILIDPVQFAMPLPWMHADGTPAGRDEVAAEWLRVKNDPTLASGGHLAAERVTRLRLTPEGVDLVVSRKLTQMDQHLAARFEGYADFPADAQLALLSLSWALGPGFSWPMLVAAIKVRDWILASHECTISEHGNPGVAPRNVANRTLLRNAAYVVANGLDPDVLQWPTDLYAADPTEPSLPHLGDEDGDRESREMHTIDSLMPTAQDVFEAAVEAREQYRDEWEKKTGEG